MKIMLAFLHPEYFFLLYKEKVRLIVQIYQSSSTKIDSIPIISKLWRWKSISIMIMNT